MKILIVAATWEEIKPLEKHLLILDEQGKLATHAIEICITGIGGILTAYHLGKILPLENWDIALQLGIGGSFKKDCEIGETVNVTTEIFADLGAEDDEDFIDVFEMKLLDENKFPFQNKILENKTIIESPAIDGFKKARGISVNKVHGNEKSIALITKKYSPDVESMEGASFFYCCKMASTSFLQLRTISNYVEKRNKANWDIPLAINNLNVAAIKLIEDLISK
ncbi:MAG: futalosine hydrolase [Chitinophagales bacterium]|nr:futalosine hydrolase [Chitinophagales bacterium]